MIKQITMFSSPRCFQSCRDKSTTSEIPITGKKFIGASQWVSTSSRQKYWRAESLIHLDNIDGLEPSIIQNAAFAAGFLEIILNF